MSGWITVAGLGPGDDALVTPQVMQALDQATDVIGYIPYVARVTPRAGLVLHPSDNRVELDRARLALKMAADGKRVVIVSSGDPPRPDRHRYPHPAGHYGHAGGGGTGRCPLGS